MNDELPSSRPSPPGQPIDFDALTSDDLWNDELFDLDKRVDPLAPIAEAEAPAVDVERKDVGGDDTTEIATKDLGREPESITAWVETFVNTLGLLLLTAYVLHGVHIDKVFTSAVPTGGDMGAHVWAPAYLRDHLLPQGQLTGWADGWYSGFPMYRYYMLPPALLIVLLDTFLPYGMAFKIVAVLGLVTLPICLWAFGKLARFAFPLPLLFAVGGTVFLFDETFKIQGGNLASTMAGEFSFSIALSLAFLAFGLFARGMETGKYRIGATLLIALAALSHGIVMLFVALGALCIYACWIGKGQHRSFWLVAPVAVAIAAFWLIPFVGTTHYMTDMKYESAPRPGTDWPTYWKMFFPHSTFTDRFWMVLLVIGVIGAVIRRHRNGIALFATFAVLCLAVPLTKNGIPGMGLLWNTRVLPFLYLTRYLLAMLGIYELFVLAHRVTSFARAGRLVTAPVDSRERRLFTYRLEHSRQQARNAWWNAALSLGAVAISLGWLAWHFSIFPLQMKTYTEKDGWKMEWPRFSARDTSVDESGDTKRDYWGWFKTDVKEGYVTSWAKWNFTGYEGKRYYAEYRTLMETMKSIGTNPEYGCGRALWEQTEGDYGTPMALMLLPYWTNGCIGSSEGLFFESSATTPYHFLTADAMSHSASNPTRGLDYEGDNAEIGADYMKQLGIRYYMAWTPEAIARAEERPELTEITQARNGPWRIYLVAGGDLVTPLAVEPVVVNERGGDQRESWLEVGTSYFQNSQEWPAIPVADGPSRWQRVDVKSVEEKEPPAVELVRPQQEIVPRALPTVTVSDVLQGDQSLSFSVDKVDVPVLVRVSYFPNWEVIGGNGPYRVAPNMMVVVPTSNQVRLEFKRSTMDWAAYLLSLIGLIFMLVIGKFVRFVKPSGARESERYGLAELTLEYGHGGLPAPTVLRAPAAHEWRSPPSGPIDPSAPLFDEQALLPILPTPDGPRSAPPFGGVPQAPPSGAAQALPAAPALPATAFDFGLDSGVASPIKPPAQANPVVRPGALPSSGGRDRFQPLGPVDPPIPQPPAPPVGVRPSAAAPLPTDPVSPPGPQATPDDPLARALEENFWSTRPNSGGIAGQAPPEAQPDDSRE